MSNSLCRVSVTMDFQCAWYHCGSPEPVEHQWQIWQALITAREQTLKTHRRRGSLKPHRCCLLGTWTGQLFYKEWRPVDHRERSQITHVHLERPMMMWEYCYLRYPEVKALPPILSITACGHIALSHNLMEQPKGTKILPVCVLGASFMGER